ncbi:GGDEF domain-containing protein [Halopseudomonas pelagia]|uniref:GGDEF domain-containing protein n=1 Tax=Halopseudomonas pelagia TaxID=553151 RepID=UPI0003A4456B|nr:GGDEF domain-containing protein [Halopseudomonas pelagia]|tara:strand:- start:346 stop:1530 length:1185 start_codon:yes stop_codon:yes gene_type:complete
MLDVTTLMLVLAFTTALSVSGLFVAAALNRQIRAIRYWTLGLAVFVVGLILQVASPPLPLWVSAAVISQAYFILWWGTRVYRDGNEYWGFAKVMLAILLVQGLLFFILRDSFRFSTQLHSVIVVVICVLSVREMRLLSGFQRSLFWLWTLLWSVHGLVYLRRFFIYLLDRSLIGAESFQAAAEIESLNYMEGIAFVYGFTLLCIVLTTRSLQDVLRRQAAVDPLTGLFNRRAFEEAAVRMLMAGQRNGRPVTLLLMDLDHFKLINDDHGHKVGDGVLVKFAQHLIDHTRVADLVCRFGGEEFVVLLPDTPQDQALHLAERIRKGWQQVAIANKGKQFEVTVSIGVAEATLDERENLYDLADRADQALYAAKQQGRNCTFSWERGLRLAAIDSLV